jgi:ribosome-binding factor A
MPTNAAGRRQERLAEQIRDEIAEKLALGELQDPRIGFTTVTRVELTPDLSHARILVSVLGSEEVQLNTIAGLSSAAGYLRREITRRLRLRRSPELTFILDHGPEEALKIEGLLEKLRNDMEK